MPSMPRFMTYAIAAQHTPVASVMAHARARTAAPRRCAPLVRMCSIAVCCERPEGACSFTRLQCSWCLTPGPAATASAHHGRRLYG
jgi:hypothetical protein